MNLQQDTLLRTMLNPGFYPHPVDQLEFIETHISQVFLTGQYAYKIKKAVNFGFLDFSDLQQRKFYCEEELRLNSRLAPGIYLEIIPITESHNQLMLNGDGNCIEYAIKMKQFDQAGLLSHLIKDKRLNIEHIHQLAEVIASFHQAINRLDRSSPLGDPNEIIKPVMHNFELLRPIINTAQLTTLTEIEDSSLLLHQQLSHVFNGRKQQGFIRECHGDLHLGNITLIDNNVVPFDGIEFNDSFRWIDTMSEIAFLLMDLEDHQKPDYACEFINHYLEITGDYHGLQVLNYYKLYRAMVRAKVTGLRLQQLNSSTDEYHHDADELNNYLQLAMGYCQLEKGSIIITHGISGSGKSWLANQLKNNINAIVIHSDKERKRRFSNQPDLYSDNITEKVYEHLLATANDIISAGYNALVDATFLSPEHRQQFKHAADKLDVEFYILNCIADKSILESRLQLRSKENNSMSDADINILHKQLENYQPLTDKEQVYTIDIATEDKIDFKEITKFLKAKK